MKSSLQRLGVALILIVFCCLTACTPFGGRLSLWSSGKSTLTIWSFFPNQDVEVIVRNYEAVHPNTNIIHTGYGFSALTPAFLQRAAQGLGPDAVIMTERDLPALIAAGLAENLDVYIDNQILETNDLSPKSLLSLQGLDGHLYGLPVAFQTMALCYNRALTDAPPATLSDWLAQSRNGITTALEAGFLKGMWGIGALGGHFFNGANEFVLDPESLVRWWNWLREAQQYPTVYIDHRPEVLYDLFATGQVAYFPCWTFEFVPLQAVLKSDLAIAPLPKSSAGQPSPYVETDTLIINPYATPQKKKLALEFAQFITQPEQQLALISGKEHTVIPVNPATFIDERLLPIIYAFAENVKSAVAFPISETYRLDRLRFYGDRLYKQVMQGVVEPEIAAQQFITRINHPPADEQIVVSTSAASDEVQAVVLVDVKNNTEYLLNLLHTLIGLLQRRAVLVQFLAFGLVLGGAWLVADYLNRWLKTIIR
ncbi:MAG: ABC transporter substrate-binding protein [Cyanobacteria bacterium P01_G01_bin.54]